jgi:uncharacterized protein YndB with AHSA1/START domain
MATTSINRYMNAPRGNVYRALVDASAVATWMVPNGMTSHVHELDAREGGSFRISLTYDAPTGTGKTTESTDTFTLTDADGGTDVLAVHDNLPPGLSPADNETGWRMSLDKLAALVEAG